MVCDVKISDEKVVLTLGACVSLVCLFAVLFMYFGLDIPNLKRHSSTLIIRRCVFEIVFVSQYLWLGFVPHNFLWSEYNSNDDDSFDCETNPSIWPLAWLTQFSLLGAELWFAALAVDIHVSLTNPFSSHRVYDMYYRIFVYTFSGIMATILVSVMPIQYGVSTDPMIWVRDQAGQVNWTKIAMFYMFVPFIYSYGAVILVWARWQIHRGLEETLQMRKYSVSKLTRYVIGYFCFYAVLYSFQFVTYLKEDFDAYPIKSSADKGFRTFCAFLLASRGVWSLGIFVIGNWQELSAYATSGPKEAPVCNPRMSGGAVPSQPTNQSLDPPKDEEELVQLNVALQKEIVRFIAQGIRQALRAVEDTDASFRSTSGRSSLSGAFGMFQMRLPGDARSFMVEENDIRPSIAVGSPIDVENPLVPRQLSHRPSTRRSLRPSVDGSVLRGPSVDQINYDMMPRPAPQPSCTPRASSSPSISALGSRLFESVRQALAPRNSFQFTDYSPKRFANIRWLSGITLESYQHSFMRTTMPDFSGGRSGAFVFFSWDYKFIVKTCTASELSTLLNLLPEYESYLAREQRRRRHSLLTRYLGAHRIIMYDIPLYFVVMQNICPHRLDEKYDLKGSWIARHGSKKKKDPAMARPKKSSDKDKSREDGSGTPLFLDNDLQNSFLLRPEASRRIAMQLDRDTRFLQQFNLMDYSLLVGVKRKLFPLGDRSEPTSPGDSSGAGDEGHVVNAAAVEGPGTFYFGLIDLLQEWTWLKWLEYLTKVLVLRMDGEGISAVEPGYYRLRFLQRAVVDVFDGIDSIPEISKEEREEEERALAEEASRAAAVASMSTDEDAPPSPASSVASQRSSLQIQTSGDRFSAPSNP